MKLSFLCDMHRQQLESKTAQAIRFWQDGFDTAKFFNEQFLWMDAIPHAGCAFETAEILITNKEIDVAVAYEWFYASCKLLVDAFESVGYKLEANQVIGMAISRFDRELTVTNTDKTLILDYLLKLHWSENFSSQHNESESFIQSSSSLTLQ
ncbi:MAG: hypothetical protein ACPHYD_02095 [Porticoccaceae bacterium]